MPHFQIQGLDRVTGVPVSEVVEAPDEQQAIKRVTFVVTNLRLVSKPSPTDRPAQRLGSCENCGSAFGALEKPAVYQGHTVCLACKDKLKAQYPGGSDFTDADANAKAAKIMARVALWIIGGLGLLALIQLM